MRAAFRFISFGIDETAWERAERSAKLKQLTTKRMVMMR
jgi:hypothetical protein